MAKVRDGLSLLLPAAFIALIFAVGILYRDFVKFPLLGPLYPLELAAFILALGLFIYGSGDEQQEKLSKRFARQFVPSKILLLFFAWGLSRLAWDLIFSPSDFPKRLVLQYSIVFIYPALWAGIAYAFFRLFFEQRNRTVLCLAAAVSLGYLLRPAHFDVHLLLLDVQNNISIGSLGIVPVLLLLATFFSPNPDRRYIFLGFVLLLLVLLPFCLMWLTAIQRTSFILLLLNIFLISVLLAGSRPRRKSLVCLFALFLLAMGSLLAISQRNSSKALITTMQRGDDQYQGWAGESEGQYFAGRFRRIFWQQTVRDWLESPYLGRGFAISIPSRFIGDTLNDGTHSGGIPIAGAHNSYLTILARMGLVGLVIFFAAAMEVFYRCLRLVRRTLNSPKGELDWPAWILPQLILNGSLYALFHLGLESPHNSILFWVGVGFCYAATEFNEVRA